MTKSFIGVGRVTDSPTQKYAKQTNDMLLNANSNIELIATQIHRLPVREQRKYLTLVLSYIDILSKANLATMRNDIALCNKIMETVNLYYEENQ
jgi:hypothetical protein